MALDRASCLEPSLKEWLQYKYESNRSYNYPEDLQRYLLFAKRYVENEEYNRSQNETTWGLTQFSDWTDAEIELFVAPNIW